MKYGVKKGPSGWFVVNRRTRAYCGYYATRSIAKAWARYFHRRGCHT